MTLEVIVPWQGGCRHREVALDWVLGRWRTHFPDVTIVIAHAEPGDWCKAKAVMPAIAASIADVVVVSDADVWCADVAGAIEAVAERGWRWAVPHLKVRRLSPDVTAGVLSGRIAPPMVGEHGLIDRERRGLPGGGLVVLGRATALEIPMDPRFVGWGGEDHAWGMALRLLAGPPWRGTEPLIHLWHPPQDRVDRVHGSEAERELRLRYRAVIRDRPGMRALLDEIEVTW